MDTAKIDLDKYQNWLWDLAGSFEDLPGLKFRRDKVMWVLYLLSRREILGIQTAKGLAIGKKLEGEQSKLKERIEGIQNAESWYLGKRGEIYRLTLGLNFFIPDWQERLAINQLRLAYFEGYKTGFLDTVNSSALSNKVLTDKWLAEIKYTYDDFYRAGKPIAYEGDRQKVIFDFSNDLGRSDFESFLSAEEQQDSGPEIEKIEWVGSQRAFGFIMYELAIKGYINAPQQADNDIDYTAYSKLLAKVFNGVGSANTLRQALSPVGEKRLVESKQKRFTIPNIKIIS